jgi:hypothetical protein
MADAPLYGPATLRMLADPQRAAVPYLSWDTEGGARAQRNLLRGAAPLRLRVLVGGSWQDSSQGPAAEARVTETGARYNLHLGRGPSLRWKLRATGGGLEVDVCDDGAEPIEAVELLWPFDARATATTALPAEWLPGGRLREPACRARLYRPLGHVDALGRARA